MYIFRYRIKDTRDSDDNGSDVSNAVISVIFIDVASIGEPKAANSRTNDDNVNSPSKINDPAEPNQTSPVPIQHKIDFSSQILASSHANGVVKFWTAQVGLL